ncbi:MAG: hypothetical protein NTX87_09300, partial [Planctomycetota bacterium]|nr:hypothetical protein [Planctomycetota bacterium]
MSRRDEQVIKRRAFLIGAACAAAGAAGARLLGARPAAAAAAAWKMRLSASSIDYSKVPIEQACERIAALGFEAIDIWSPHAKC